ncbi:hypothetical protein MPAR168_13450 [Methylorubrum populi]|uniref:DUF2188 domain-containing protein n=1 Tax=Methylobacterium radiotolerans TaxID=31998 RepID=A0ABU7TCP7_9HYPH
MQDESTSPRVARPDPTDVSVEPRDGQWVVRRAGAARRSDVYATQDEALRAAQALTRPEGGQLLIQDANGHVRESFTLGRLAFEKISAVEGIRLSRDMKRDLRRSAEAATPDAARQLLAEKYGSTIG